jgi:hypothetical protein
MTGKGRISLATPTVDAKGSAEAIRIRSER